MRGEKEKPESRRQQSFPLRLSPTLRQQALEFAQSEGLSLNHFIGMAIAEKIGRMESTTQAEVNKSDVIGIPEK